MKQQETCDVYSIESAISDAPKFIRAVSLGPACPVRYMYYFMECDPSGQISGNTLDSRLGYMKDTDTAVLTHDKAGVVYKRLAPPDTKVFVGDFIVIEGCEYFVCRFAQRDCIGVILVDRQGNRWSDKILPMMRAANGDYMHYVTYADIRKYLKVEPTAELDITNGSTFLKGGRRAAPARYRQVDGELKALFILIDQERFNEARGAIAALRTKLGDADPELTRASSLIRFLEGAE